MIHVFSVSYYYEKHHEINEHVFDSFERACQVVAEVWLYSPNNVYTIVDNTEVL